MQLSLTQGLGATISFHCSELSDYVLLKIKWRVHNSVY